MCMGKLLYQHMAYFYSPRVMAYAEQPIEKILLKEVPLHMAETSSPKDLSATSRTLQGQHDVVIAALRANT